MLLRSSLNPYCKPTEINIKEKPALYLGAGLIGFCVAVTRNYPGMYFITSFSKDPESRPKDLLD